MCGELMVACVACGAAGDRCGACEQRGHIAEAAAWHAGTSRLPADWPERQFVEGDTLQDARSAELRYTSRRRAEAESDDALTARPLPKPPPSPTEPRRQQAPRQEWPADAPPRPIHIRDTYNPGVYDGEIMPAVRAAQADCKRLEAGGQSGKRRDDRVWTEASRPDWCKHLVLDARADPADCQLLQPSSVEEPLDSLINAEFFHHWETAIGWADADMIHQVSVTGVASRSAVPLHTKVMSHHGGVRKHFKQVDESVKRDSAEDRRWISPGSEDLPFSPAIMIPKNCVVKDVWRFNDAMQLYHKRKYRVSSDESMAVDDSPSRNDCMPRDEWPDTVLCTPQTLAEAVAIIKAQAALLGIDMRDRVLCERVALWALDLSDAYRALPIDNAEAWQQCFVWTDGVRVDSRCLFGSAHLVGFFQRVSSFVLAVVAQRIRDYDARNPLSPERREAAARHTARVADGEQGTCFQQVYLDDAMGATVMAPSERWCVKLPRAKYVDGKLKLDFEHERPFTLARPDMHLVIAASTFEEAGWRCGPEKMQRGLTVVLLGLGITSVEAGALFCPEEKRRGYREELRAVRAPDGDGCQSRDTIESVTGRLGHISQIEPGGKLYLNPMYIMANASRRGRFGRVSLTRVAATGTAGHRTPKQQAFLQAVDWWDQALDRGISTPLAPRLAFPNIGDLGCALLVTDAARERSTGYGGFAPGERDGVPLAIVTAAPWSDTVGQLLRDDVLSMPSGEMLAVVAQAIAVVTRVPSITHLIFFTDADAVRFAINSGGSPSPQMNFLFSELLRVVQHRQLLAIHIPGALNTRADALSRDGPVSVVGELVQAGFAVEHDTTIDAHVHALAARAATYPQRRS